MDTHLSAAAAAAADDEHGCSSALQQLTKLKCQFSQCQNKLPNPVLKYDRGRHTQLSLLTQFTLLANLRLIVVSTVWLLAN